MFLRCGLCPDVAARLTSTCPRAVLYSPKETYLPVFSAQFRLLRGSWGSGSCCSRMMTTVACGENGQSPMQWGLQLAASFTPHHTHAKGAWLSPLLSHTSRGMYISVHKNQRERGATQRWHESSVRPILSFWMAWDNSTDGQPRQTHSPLGAAKDDISV